MGVGADAVGLVAVAAAGMLQCFGVGFVVRSGLVSAKKSI